MRSATAWARSEPMAVMALARVTAVASGIEPALFLSNVVRFFLSNVVLFFLSNLVLLSLSGSVLSPPRHSSRARYFPLQPQVSAAEHVHCRIAFKVPAWTRVVFKR
uniref:Uncharacterized protein n=1 Tax=Chrysotila carterae TaxID=13221 RepID=A0A7S4C440_CHRCT